MYGWYGLQGQGQTWHIQKREDPTQRAGDVLLLPHCGADPYGMDTALGYYKAIKPDVMITCMDIWVMPAPLVQQMKVSSWVPIDHDPVPQGILNSLAPCIYPMSFSKWGTELLQACKIDAHYVPCSADSAIFKPMPQQEARSKLSIPDDIFIVAMVAANKDPSDRKGFGEALAGFAKFAQGHPDARMYIHTNWGGPINIEHLAERLGIANLLMRPDPLTYLSGGYDDNYMRLIYCTADVLLNPAKSEGFGLPILEAQMCGTPAALSDYSTTDELLFAGWRISGQKNWSIGADSWRLLVHIDSVVEALEEAYRNRGNEVLRKQARQGAIAYDTKYVADKYWRPALAEIEEIVCAEGGRLKMVTF